MICCIINVINQYQHVEDDCKILPVARYNIFEESFDENWCDVYTIIEPKAIRMTHYNYTHHIKRHMWVTVAVCMDVSWFHLTAIHRTVLWWKFSGSWWKENSGSSWCLMQKILNVDLMHQGDQKVEQYTNANRVTWAIVTPQVWRRLTQHPSISPSTCVTHCNSTSIKG